MKKNYKIEKAIRNPYYEKAKKGELKFVYKKQVTIRLDNDVIDYFKDMSVEMDVPYQSLINMYLHDCVKTKRKIAWK